MILVDPGHGPGDGVVTDRVIEHEYCYNMAERIAVDNDGLVISRTHYEDPTNRRRAHFARYMGCRLALSLHVNSGPPEYSGAHAFHRPHSVRGREVAEAIMTAWPKDLSRKSLYGENRSFGWVEGAVAKPNPKRWPRVAQVFKDFGDLDLVLVEMFYATNQVEVELAQQASYREEMELALLRGIVVARRESPHC